MKIIYFFEGYSKDYKIKNQIILAELKSKNIIVSSFVGDNLKVQIAILKITEMVLLRKPPTINMQKQLVEYVVFVKKKKKKKDLLR